MTNPDHIDVDLPALTAYAGQLGYYQTEADKFSGLVDDADVTNEAWGLIGIWAKKSYTDQLGELRSLLADMKAGAETLSEKMTDTAAVYQGNEDDTAMTFGAHEAYLDGPR